MTPFQALLLLGVCLAWGLHMVVIKATVDLVPPLTYVAFRMALLALLLSPLLRWHKGQMLRVVMGGMCFGGLNYAFMFSGFKFTTAAVGAILAESYVVFATLLGVLVLGEKVGWRRSLGIGVALVGVTVIATADGEAAGSRNLPLGAALILTAMLIEATGALFVKKIDGIKPLQLLSWFAVVGCVLTFVIAALFNRDHFAWLTSEAALPVGGALVYSVVVASIFGHTSYYYILQRAPLSLVAPSGLLITFFAVLFGVTLLGESLTPQLIAGALLVILGVGVVLVRAHPPDRKQVIAASAADAEEREAEA